MSLVVSSNNPSKSQIFQKIGPYSHSMELKIGQRKWSLVSCACIVCCVQKFVSLTSRKIKGTGHDFYWSGKTHLSSSEARIYTHISKQTTKSQ